MSGKSRGIITASLVVTMILGSLNSIVKRDKLPSFRFYFGTGVLYLMLEGLASFEEEIAKSIAIAIVTFTVLGEGGGVLDHFLGAGASGSILDTQPSKPASRPTGGGGHPTAVTQTRKPGGVNAGTAIGMAPIKPALVR